MLDLTKERHAHIEERLRSDPLIWLSTVKPDGKPHIVPVWFLWDGDTFLIFSKPDQKIKNLQHNSAVMLGLDDTKRGSNPIMAAGEATLLKHSDVTASHAPYFEKYADFIKRFGWTADSMSKEYSEVIRIRPTKFF